MGNNKIENKYLQDKPKCGNVMMPLRYLAFDF